MIASPPPDASTARSRGEELFNSLLLLRSTTHNSSSSSSASSSSSMMASNKPLRVRKSSIRRRDVIKPLLLEELTTAAVATTAAATDDNDKEKECTTTTTTTNNTDQNRCGDDRRRHHDHKEGRRASNSTALVLHPLVLRQHQVGEQNHHQGNNRHNVGMDPSTEIVKYDSGNNNNNNNNNNIDTLAVYHHSTPTTLPDPPGEAPTNHPIVCTDLMIGCAGSSRNSYNNNYSSRSQYCSSNNYQNTVLWMDPKNVHDPNMVDWNVLRRYDDLMSSSASSSSASTNSSTVAPSSSSPPLPSQSSSSYHHPTTSTATHHPLLLSNPRTRIATISTGFTAATFFVREDLDTRIYFNQLEDAIGYMGRRGYVKMNKEEEREWRSILECAHKVVKVGPTKRKQLYRKGKIVLILKKTIVNEGIEEDYHNHVKKSWSKKQLMIESGANHGGGEVGGVLTVRRTKKKQMEEEDESQATTTTTPSTNDNDDSNCSTSSDSSSSSGSNIRRKNNNFSNFKKLLDSSAASASACSTADQTDRTSLGRSTRWPYKSYSEKFLAQQDEEKRQCLLAIMEGRPLLLENGAGADPSSLLLLTDGGNEYRRTGPIDPDADIIPSSGRSGCNYDDDDWRNSSAQFSSTSATATATNGMLEESQRSFYSKLHGGSTSHRGSARRGVYGGGVRYFTPDYSQYSESDEEEEDGGNVGEESGDDEGALYEAEEEEDFQTSDDIESTNDSAFVVEEEEEVAPFVTESKKREKSMKK